MNLVSNKNITPEIRGGILVLGGRRIALRHIKSYWWDGSEVTIEFGKDSVTVGFPWVTSEGENQRNATVDERRDARDRLVKALDEHFGKE